MAVVFRKTKQNTCYEVRTAGKSIRLYTDGIFHSQWNPSRPLGGNLWDLLFLPVFFYQNRSALKNVLVLGVGGGAVINQFNIFFPPQAITGVDLDRVHLQVAKKYFGCEQDNVSLVHADAKDFVEQARVGHYSFIVEDLFLGSSSDPSDARRAIEASLQWLSCLMARLEPTGVLVVNYESPKQFRKASAPSVLKTIGVQAAYALNTPGYENTIGVYLKKRVSKRDFNSALAGFIKSQPADCVKHLQVEVSRLSI